VGLSSWRRVARDAVRPCWVNAFAAVTLAWLLGAIPARAQDSHGDDLDISLVTVGPGSAALSWFGHAGMLVTQRHGSTPLFFDYGRIRLDRGTIHDAFTGRVYAYTAATNWHESLSRWQAAGRWVRIQPLSLSAAQKRDIFARLTADESAGRRRYLYDYLNNSCATRLRDVLDAALHGALRNSAGTGISGTARSIGYEKLSLAWTAAFDLLFNRTFDTPLSPWDAATYPDRLAELVAHASVVDSTGTRHALVASPPIVYGNDRAGALSGSRLPFVIAGIVLAAITTLIAGASTFWPRSARVALGAWAAFVGLVLGVAGTFVAASMVVAHSFAVENWNAVIANPVMFAAIPLGVGYARDFHAARRALIGLVATMLILSLAVAAVSLAAAHAQDNSRTLFVLIPLEAALLAAIIAVPPGRPMAALSLE
jgi:hypothetical protein